MAWEDEGLWFTFILNGVLLVVLLVGAYLVHSRRRFARVLRPNRPGSRTATFFREPGALFSFRENEVLHTVGVTPTIYILMLKYLAFIFCGIMLSCVVIVALCATDSYLNQWRLEQDPDQCADKGASECSDTIKCQNFGVPVNINGRVAACQPNPRHGLYDFSLQNIAVNSWRLYLFAVVLVLCCVPIAFFTYMICQTLYNLIRVSFIRPIFSGLSYGGLATVGARTVLIGGLPKDAVPLSDNAKFVEFLFADSNARAELLKARVGSDFKFKPKRRNQKSKTEQSPSRPNPQLQEQQQDQSATTLSAIASDPFQRSNVQSAAAERGLDGPPADLTAPSWVIARERAITESVSVVQQAPKDLIDLIEEEKQCLERLKNDVAAEQFETDPEKKPVKKRVLPLVCKQVPAVAHEKEELERIRSQIDKRLLKREKQPMTGAVLVSFDRASSAYAFIRQYNKEQGHLGSSRATIAGPRDQVVWDNLGVDNNIRRIRFAIMLAIFTILVFFWSVPVAFLGNLDRLESLPGVGNAFASALNSMPTVVITTLSAYLPVIVLVVFNLLLPWMFATFGKFGGAKTVPQMSRSVLLMCAIFSIMTGIVLQAALQGGFTQVIALIQHPSSTAVLNLLIAIVSPQGGYWYAYLISAAVIGTLLALFVIGPLIISTFMGKMYSGRQEGYDAMFEPRDVNYPYVTGRHLFFSAIGMFFHGTVAFLQPFAAAYTVSAYYTERSVIIDGAKEDKVPIIDYKFALTFLHSVLALHTVAAVGNVVVCALKKSYGSPIIAALALIANILLHVYVEVKLRPLVEPSPELVASLESEMAHLNVPFESIDDVEPYVPDFAFYEMDENAVEDIERHKYEPADKTWPKPGMTTVNDPPPKFLCFGEEEGHGGRQWDEEQQSHSPEEPPNTTVVDTRQKEQPGSRPYGASSNING